VETGLDDDVLLGVYRPAYFMLLTGRDIVVVPETSQFQAVGEASWRAVKAGGQYVHISNSNRSYMVTAAGRALSNNRGYF
jgi:hypothetical protein